MLVQVLRDVVDDFGAATVESDKLAVKPQHDWYMWLAYWPS